MRNTDIVEKRDFGLRVRRPGIQTPCFHLYKNENNDLLDSIVIKNSMESDI